MVKESVNNGARMKKKRWLLSIQIGILLSMSGCSFLVSESNSCDSAAFVFSGSSDSESSEISTESSSTQSSVDGTERIITYSDLEKIRKNPSGHFVLEADIDCYNSALQLGTFSGVLDGNGHSICNVKNSGNYNGIFSIVEKSAIIKNIGFYNISTTMDNKYHMAFMNELHGTIENVSFYQGGVYAICALFNKIEEGSRIRNFVAYAGNVTTSGFFNSGNVSKMDVAENIYIFSNIGNANSIQAADAYFYIGVSGKDYMKTEEYAALNFQFIFDCTASGVWEYDFNLGIPLVRHLSVSMF